MKKFNDVDDCDHDMIDYDAAIGGKLAETKIEGVYASTFHCPDCNHFLQEVYHFEGLQQID